MSGLEQPGHEQPVDLSPRVPAVPAALVASSPELAAAAADADALVAAADAAATRSAACEDALEDAEADHRVAVAKAEDHAGDDSKERWQRVAAGEAVTRAARRVDRARAAREAAYAAHEAALDAAEVAVHEVTTLAAATTSTAPVAGTPAPGEPGAADEPSLYFANAAEFISEFLRFEYRRELSPMGEFRWCPEWWRFGEAVSRLDALWRAWEHLRLDPGTGLSVWWRDHADHHMRVLFSAEGPFGRDSAETAHGEPLPVTPPPEGLFRDERATRAEESA